MRVNQNYVIVNSINVGDTEFVLGVNMKAPSQFVTWECKDGTDYFWGHYFSNQLSAQKDLCTRGLETAKLLEHNNRPKKKDYER